MKGLKVSELKQLIHNCTANDDEIVTKEAIDRLFDEAGDDYEVITLEDFNCNRYTEFRLERENKLKKAALAYWDWIKKEAETCALQVDGNDSVGDIVEKEPGTLVWQVDTDKNRVSFVKVEDSK